MRRTSSQSSRRGANIVEFAFIAPVLVGLTFAIMDFSWYFVAMNWVQEVALESARVGAQTDPNADEDNVPATEALEAAEALLAAAYPVNNMASSVQVQDDGTNITVQVNLTFRSLVGVFPTPPQIVLSATRPLENPVEDD